MKIDQCGFPIFDSNDLINIMYQGNLDKIFNVFVEKNSEISTFNELLIKSGNTGLTLYNPPVLSDDDVEAVHSQLQATWFMPESYKNLNLTEYLLNKCKTPEERARVLTELAEFNRREMNALLQYMVYLVDFMRENRIVWGVGRGSSVASYVLYLIGVHRVDSLKYDLDFKEFMR